MALPTEKSIPKKNLFDYPIFIHGQPKIGKSTVVSEIPNILFADTEGGLSALEVYKQPITSWNNGEGSFLQLCSDFTKEEHNYVALCIDTVDRLHKLCQHYVMVKHDITHPSDLDWGKGWELVKDEFMRPLIKLSLSPYGLILISHTKMIEITTRTSKLTKAIPTLQPAIWEQVDAFVSIELYFTIEETEDGEERIIKTRPSEKWIAGDRTGKLLNHEKLEMSWNAIETAFKGEKTKTNLLLGGK